MKEKDLFEKDLFIEIIKKFNSQVNFSLESGIHQSIISRVLNGHLKLGPKQAIRWQKALDCSPELLAAVTK